MKTTGEALNLDAGYFRNMMDVLEIWQRDFSIAPDLKVRARELHLEARCRVGAGGDAERTLSTALLVAQYTMLTRDIAVRSSVAEPEALPHVYLFRPGLKFMKLLAHSCLRQGPWRRQTPPNTSARDWGLYTRLVGAMPATREMKEAHTVRFQIYLRLHLYLENHLSAPPSREFKETYQAGLLDQLLASQGAFQLSPDQYRILYQGLPDLNLVWLLLHESTPSLAAAKQDYAQRIVPLRDAAEVELATTSPDPATSEEWANDTVYSMEGGVQEAIASRINHVERHLLAVPTVDSFLPAHNDMFMNHSG